MADIPLSTIIGGGIPAASGFAWTTVVDADVSPAVTNTGYLMRTGGFEHSVELPASAPAGFNVTVNAHGGQVLVLSNGNTIDGIGAGNDLVLEDGNTATLAAVSVGLLELVSAYAGTPAVGLSVNTGLPVVTGGATVGAIASTTTGSWTESPFSYTYQWQEEIAAVWTDVAGATANTYTTTAEGPFRVQVVAINAAGASAPAGSTSFVVGPAVVASAPIFVSSSTDRTTTSTAEVALVSSTAANAFFVMSTDDNSGSAPTVSDSKGGTWTEVINFVGGGNRCVGWLCQNVVGDIGGGHTFTVNNVDFGTVHVIAMERGTGTVSVDALSAVLSSSGTPYASNTLTPTATDSLAIACVTTTDTGSTSNAFTVGSPWTLRTDQASEFYFNGATATRVLTAASGVTATFAKSGSTSTGGVRLLNLIVT